jgi:RHS repeat-associated protein
MERVVGLSVGDGANIANTYDSVARLTGTYLHDSGGSLLDQYAYGYNLAGQRTNVVRTAGDHVQYAYDNIGELTTANGFELSGASRLQEQLGYAYDAAGNLNLRTNNALVQNFNVNRLNELTNIIRSGTFTVAGTTSSGATNVTVNTSNAVLYADHTFASTNFTLVNGTNTFTAIARDFLGNVATNIATNNLPVTNSYSYDLNGNVLTNGAKIFAYDDENELISVMVTSNWQSQFIYDGKMRRRIERDYIWNGSAWVETNEIHFIYDGNVVIQERDINNLPKVTYTRGKDLSGSLQGAGGIGGLLARSDNTQMIIGSPTAHAYYHADGNGNVTMLINSYQAIVAKYLYDPFGNTLSLSGSLAEANTYRFSSKELNDNAGLYYYLYRYYDPNLQRWPNRDPLGDEAFLQEQSRGKIRQVKQLLREQANLPSYLFVKNNPESKIDPFGLAFSSTTFNWTVPRCGADSQTAFIQVGLGGSARYNQPFVDDGKHGPGSDKPTCPPLYPNGGIGGTVSAAGDNNSFSDNAGMIFGLNDPLLNGLEFEVCRVCLKPCCGGYKIVSVGPCRVYTLPGNGGSVDLDDPGVSTHYDSPSAAFNQTVSSSYSGALNGGCITCPGH